jgi:hypothetical protein
LNFENFCIALNKKISLRRTSACKAEAQNEWPSARRSVGREHSMSLIQERHFMSAQNKIARRTFFAGLGLAAAAGVAAKLAPQSVAQAAAAAPQEPQGNGYRLSEHVKKYYRSTKI